MDDRPDEMDIHSRAQAAVGLSAAAMWCNPVKAGRWIADQMECSSVEDADRLGEIISEALMIIRRADHERR
jgi:hypothetical protein